MSESYVFYSADWDGQYRNKDFPLKGGWGIAFGKPGGHLIVGCGVPSSAVGPFQTFDGAVEAMKGLPVG